MRTIATWIIALGVVALVGLELEERSVRQESLDEARYQSCMAQLTGGGVNLLMLDARMREASGSPSIFSGEGGELPNRHDEGINRCSRRYAHTTTPTTAP